MGNTCRRGDLYARKEVTNPTRIVTSTVDVVTGTSGTVSVKQKKIFRKRRYFAGTGIKRNRGSGAGTHWDAILENVAGTGVDMVAQEM